MKKKRKNNHHSINLFFQTESKHKGGDLEPPQQSICEATKELLIEQKCQEHSETTVKEDPLEKEGLEALLSFINGKDAGMDQSKKDKEASAKAAKRARQKQKKVCSLLLL